MSYNFDVSCRKEALNTVVDALYRKPELSIPQLMVISSFSTDLMERITTWKQDSELSNLIEKLKNNTPGMSTYSC